MKKIDIKITNKILFQPLTKTIIVDLIDKYHIKDMNDWYNVNADLIITDPPFGIGFSGKKGNYHRDESYVVDGYVEWDVNEYDKHIRNLLDVIYRNLKDNGQCLIFSGWNNSYIIHQEIKKFKKLELKGKLYWIYNFAPASFRRPSHNIYEIFWLTKGDKWTFHKRCSTHHCLEGEPNLTSLIFKRDYKVKMPKYPTRLPFKLLQCLIEHFSNEKDLIFDPLAGSGMVGIVAYYLNRDFILGDLNPNGKIVFESLLDYYFNKNGLEKDKQILLWWKKKLMKKQD
ncbi:MAG: methyltransferase [Candidatus Parcubacteria bacterium]|nr:MAG: methyltransferase [Candidatus Parcubacteria bacterium]